MLHRIAEIGILAPGAASLSALWPALVFLETALGVRFRLVGAEDSALPQRLIVLGAPGKAGTPTGPRIVLFLPAATSGTDPLRRTDWIEPGPIPVFGHVERFRGTGDLPWCYLGGGTPISWTNRGGQTLLQLGFDLLAPIASCLSRDVELNAATRTAWQHGLTRELPSQERQLAPNPWIDRLLLMLESLLDLRAEDEEDAPVLPRWPGGARFAVALSHDVDMLFKWRFRSAIRLLLESPLKALGGGHRELARRWRELLARLAGGRDPWFLVDEMMDLEERHGWHSSFMFLAEPRDHQTFRYHLDRPLVRGMLARIRERGWEIGLHGGWLSYNDPVRLRSQKALLERLLGVACPLVRQHWLRFDADLTWSAQEQAGLFIDSSLGFNDLPGFRTGTSLPFHPGTPAGQIRPHLEIPLSLMDSQLFDEQALSSMAAWKQTEDLLEQVKRVRGLLTVNWHPHTLCRPDFPGRAELYERLLEVLDTRSCWVSSLGGVASHWLTREERLRRREQPMSSPLRSEQPLCAS